MSAAASQTQAHAAVAVLLSVEDEGWLAEGLGDEAAIEALVARALAAASRRAGLPEGLGTELGVTLTGDAAIRALNAEWRGKGEATNVLSFPMEALAPGNRPGALLGDLVLARETLRREADAEGKPLADHFSHLLVHGVLHCLGHDHETAEDAAAMERLETLILADLTIRNPYQASWQEAEEQGADEGGTACRAPLAAGGGRP